MDGMICWQVLKYLVMASILHESKIDPFDSQEAKPYKQDPEIVAMTNLVTAFRNKQMKVPKVCIDAAEGGDTLGHVSIVFIEKFFVATHKGTNPPDISQT